VDIDTVVDVVDSDVETVTVSGAETVPEYKSIRLPPPQYSYLFPSQRLEQSAVATLMLPPLRVFPQ